MILIEVPRTLRHSGVGVGGHPSACRRARHSPSAFSRLALWASGLACLWFAGTTAFALSFAGTPNPDGTVSIEGHGPLTESVLVIPSTLKGKRVTGIRDMGFADRSILTELAIPEGVERIGGASFARCSSLVRVTFPESLEEIGDFAFESCKALKRIVIPDGVRRLGIGAFAGCTGVTNAIPR